MPCEDVLRLDETGKESYEGRLPGSVASEERMDLARAHREREAVEGDDMAVDPRNLAYVYDGVV